MIEKYTCIEFPYFKIIGDCNDEGSSGLYLNGIPGITLKRASAIADENYLSGLELIRADEKESVETVIRDILMEISDSINTGLIHSSKDKKIVYHEDAEYVTPGTTGIKIVSNNTDPYSSTLIHYLEFYSKTAGGNITYTITDGEDTTTITQALLKGYNKIQVDYTCRNNLVYITADFGAEELIKDSLSSCKCYNTCAIVSPVDGSFEDVEDNVLGYQISCICDDVPLICRFAEYLKNAVRFQLGIKLMTRLLVSDNAVPVVYNGQDQAKYLLKLWSGGIDTVTGKMIPGEYFLEIKKISKMIRNFLKSNGSVCFGCESNFKIVSNLP